MTRREPPPAVIAAATARAEARDQRDWTAADRLRGEIEAAGWTVTDDADRFRLRPAHPSDLDIGGLVRYGWSGAVPRRGRDAARHGDTVAIVVDAHGTPTGSEAVAAAVTRAATAASPDRHILLILDGLGRADPPAIAPAIDSAASVEVIATAGPVGPAGCLDIVLRRAQGERVIVTRAVGPAAAVLVALVSALDDPSVAIVGLQGIALDRLPRLTPDGSGDADAVSLDDVAFRLDAAAELGEPDLRLRTRAGVGAWLSRSLATAPGIGGPRRVVVLDAGTEAVDALAGADEAAAALRRDGYRLLRDQA